MAVSANNAAELKKKRWPPTFQHLPRNRAAKLKKEWVEKAKIKSVWKMQKRKERAAAESQRDVPPHLQKVAGANETESMDEEGDDNDEEADDNEGRRNDDSQSETGSIAVEQKAQVSPRKREVRFSSESHLEASSRPHSKSKGKSVQRFNEPRKSSQGRLSREGPSSATTTQSAPRTESQQQESKSLRELTRAAYSPAELHKFKAKHGQRKGGRGADKTGALIHKRMKNGQQDKRGGQPNMKLRMEAMLERIKRDYS